jgi:hypothetical protein
VFHSEAGVAAQLVLDDALGRARAVSPRHSHGTLRSAAAQVSLETSPCSAALAEVSVETSELPAMDSPSGALVGSILELSGGIDPASIV